MAVVPAALSKETRLAMSAVGTATPVNQFVTFTRFNTGCEQTVLDTGRDVNMGTRSHYASRVRNNQRRVQPTLALKPTVGEWESLLQWVCGGTPTGTTTLTYPLAEAAPTRVLNFDDTQKFWSMSDVAVDRAVFAASAGAELTLDLELLGTDFSNTGSFPAGLSPDTAPPLLMNDLALTIGGTTANARSFRLTVSNGLNRERYFNAAVLAGPVAMDRTIEISVSLPWGAHAALWDAGAGDAGVAITAVFTYDSKVLSVSLPAVRAPEKPIEASVPEELFVEWTGIAGASAPGNEMTITLTP